jgi:YVTN family beta-propeller protein
MPSPTQLLTGIALALTVAACNTPAKAQGTEKPALTGTLVVVNQKDHDVCLFDVATGKLVKRVKTGIGPHEAATSPDGKTIAVTNYGTAPNAEGPGNSLTIISLPSGQVEKTVSLGEYTRPHGIAFLDNRRAIVTSETTKNLVIVDIEKGAVDRAIPTEQPGSHMLSLSADGKRVATANVGSATVSIFDVAGKKLGDVPADAGSEGVGISPDGEWVYTGNRGAHTVSVVDVKNLKNVKNIPAPQLPYRAAFTPDGKSALVACPVGGAFVVYDPQKMEEKKRIDFTNSEIKIDSPVPPGPTGIAVHPNSRFAFCTMVMAGAVAVIDLEKGTIISVWKTGASPDGVAYSAITVQD